MKGMVWYYRGREARMRNEPRDKRDGRMSPTNRAAFQRGWDDESAQRVAAVATPEQQAEARAVLRRLKAWAATEL